MLFNNDDSELCINYQNGVADKAATFSEGFCENKVFTHSREFCPDMGNRPVKTDIIKGFNPYSHQNQLFGGHMATIYVKKSRKPEFLRGLSRNRRHARRKAEAISKKNIEMKLDSISPTRKNVKPISRVEKAISIHSTKVYDSVDNTCLPNASIYSAKYRKSGTLLESGEVTARA